MRWIGHEGGSHQKTFLQLNKAKNYDDYVDALQHWVTPSQNFVFRFYRRRYRPVDSREVSQQMGRTREVFNGREFARKRLAVLHSPSNSMPTPRTQHEGL